MAGRGNLANIAPTMGKGRVKGVKNKFPKAVKSEFVRAFQELGGWRWIVERGRSPHMAERIACGNWISRLLPLDFAGAFDGMLTVKIVTQLGEEINVYQDAKRIDLPTDGKTLIGETVEHAPIDAPVEEIQA